MTTPFGKQYLNMYLNQTPFDMYSCGFGNYNNYSTEYSEGAMWGMFSVNVATSIFGAILTGAREVKDATVNAYKEVTAEIKEQLGILNVDGGSYTLDDFASALDDFNDAGNDNEYNKTISEAESEINKYEAMLKPTATDGEVYEARTAYNTTKGEVAALEAELESLDKTSTAYKTKSAELATKQTQLEEEEAELKRVKAKYQKKLEEAETAKKSAADKKAKRAAAIKTAIVKLNGLKDEYDEYESAEGSGKSYDLLEHADKSWVQRRLAKEGDDKNGMNVITKFKNILKKYDKTNDETEKATYKAQLLQIGGNVNGLNITDETVKSGIEYIKNWCKDNQETDAKAS